MDFPGSIRESELRKQKSVIKYSADDIIYRFSEIATDRIKLRQWDCAVLWYRSHLMLFVISWDVVFAYAAVRRVFLQLQFKFILFLSHKWLMIVMCEFAFENNHSQCRSVWRKRKRNRDGQSKNETKNGTCDFTINQMNCSQSWQEWYSIELWMRTRARWINTNNRDRQSTNHVLLHHHLSNKYSDAVTLQTNTLTVPFQMNAWIGGNGWKGAKHQ